MATYDEDDFEQAALEWFEEIGWQRAYGPQISPGGPTPERTDFGSVLLFGRLAAAIRRLNPGIADATVVQAVANARRAQSQDLVRENFRWHFILRDGVPVEVRGDDGQTRHLLVRLVDLRDPSQNDFLVVNQFRVDEPTGKRRADIVAFVNGIPIAVFELKRPSDEDATIHGAYNQLQTYAAEIPSLLAPTAINVIADGANCRAGALTATIEFYSKWRTIEREIPAAGDIPTLKVLIHGMFDQSRLLEIIEFFIDFGETSGKINKRLARYNQYWGVKAAVDRVVAASAEGGDRRGGVVSHGQGSGKSMELLLAANRLMRMPELNSPTIVVLSDRNDLDDQILRKEFGPSRILPEPAVQAVSRSDLRSKLDRASGGIIITTIQKFDLEKGTPSAEAIITDRRNVIVMADEAHRTQYGLIDGFASDMRKALPNATFVGFTGTPIDLSDRSTAAVFGDVISTYSPKQAVDDGATVPILYESRVAAIRLAEDAEIILTEAIDQITEGLSEDEQAHSLAQWARLEAILSAEPVVERIVDDFLEHWERRRQSLKGKALLVGMTRSIVARLYEKIADKRPDWVSDDDAKGIVKAVYTGSAADDSSIQKHVRTKDALSKLKERAQDPDDPLEIIVVCDLWLTGFDSPALHTMYLAKLMKGHGLFQAVTRPNRVYRDKPAGLIVSYVPVLDALNAAVGQFSKGGNAPVGELLEQAEKAMLAAHDAVKGILAGHDWTSTAPTAAKRSEQITKTAAYLALDKDKDERFAKQVLALVKLQAICGSLDSAVALRDDIGFFAAVRASRTKLEGDDPLGKPSKEQMATAMQQLIDGAIEADSVIDVYAEAGIDKPEISLLSEETLAKIKAKPYPSLQIALLKKILNGQISILQRKNKVKSLEFAEALALAVQRYENRTLSDAEIIAALVELAKEMRAEEGRASSKGLSTAELAFYDAVIQNESAMELGDETLRKIAQELVVAIRASATLDWRDRDSVQAELRIKVKTLLKRYKYPPDGQEKATDLVIEQAELFTEDMLAA